MSLTLPPKIAVQRGGRRAKLQCQACSSWFEASARRVRMTQRGEASCFCPECLVLNKRANVNVLGHHRRYWTDKVRKGDMIVTGGKLETIDEQWIREVGEAIWG